MDSARSVAEAVSRRAIRDSGARDDRMDRCHESLLPTRSNSPRCWSSYGNGTAGVLVTSRTDGSPQLSPVTCGLDSEERIVVSTYPSRAKTRNARRNPQVSICVLSDDWNGPYVQVDGRAEVLDMPEALDPIATGGFPPEQSPE